MRLIDADALLPLRLRERNHRVWPRAAQRKKDLLRMRQKNDKGHCRRLRKKARLQRLCG